MRGGSFLPIVYLHLKICFSPLPHNTSLYECENRLCEAVWRFSVGVLGVVGVTVTGLCSEELRVPRRPYGSEELK
jgi:hypothetical protein